MESTPSLAGHPLTGKQTAFILFGRSYTFYTGI
jgi:hypothetical protein